jgi:hypothetical protein
MAGKFNRKSTKPHASGPVVTVPGETVTYEGGKAYTHDTKSALLLLAVTNMVGEDTFYESAKDRDDRYSALVRQAAVEDPKWTFEFVRWLRGSANMRSASLVAAAEAVHARLDYFKALSMSPGPDAYAPEDLGSWNRKIVDAALQRADEPGEFLAYWMSKYSTASRARLPMPVKRGVGDAARRLYTQRAVLKYNTGSVADGVNFGRVLDLTHPSNDESKVGQGALFQYILDKLHNPDNAVIPSVLRTLLMHDALREAVKTNPEALYDGARLTEAGFTWEAAIPLAGQVGADKRRVWEALIPSMGIMALIRNLRNFDEVGVSDEIAEIVLAQLRDPQVIAQSRQFPFRFLSAYRAAPSDRWAYALDKALTLSTANIPAFPGRTLVLVDTSQSMTTPVSARSKIRHVDIGALFGVALAAKGESVDLIGFADGTFRQELVRGGSVLKQTERFTSRIGEVGHGTQTAAALRKTFKNHDRVVIFSDMQAFVDGGTWGWGQNRRDTSAVSNAVPANVPMFGVDTSGYDKPTIQAGVPNRHEIGGFSDKMFTMMALLDRGHDAGWPWEV